MRVLCALRGVVAMLATLSRVAATRRAAFTPRIRSILDWTQPDVRGVAWFMVQAGRTPLVRVSGVTIGGATRSGSGGARSSRGCGVSAAGSAQSPCSLGSNVAAPSGPLSSVRHASTQRRATGIGGGALLPGGACPTVSWHPPPRPLPGMEAGLGMEGAGASSTMWTSVGAESSSLSTTVGWCRPGGGAPGAPSTTSTSATGPASATRPASATGPASAVPRVANAPAGGSVLGKGSHCGTGVGAGLAGGSLSTGGGSARTGLAGGLLPAGSSAVSNTRLVHVDSRRRAVGTPQIKPLGSRKKAIWVDRL